MQENYVSQALSLAVIVPAIGEDFARLRRLR